jgi:septal ring factor EnvC (AmiA/AmiB activator)
MLTELAMLPGSLSGVLSRLADVLVPAIFSSYAAAMLSISKNGGDGNNSGSMDHCRPVGFQQLPWYAVAARLHMQNTELERQQVACRQELALHQVWFSAIMSLALCMCLCAPCTVITVLLCNAKQDHVAEVEKQLAELCYGLQSRAAELESLRASSAAATAAHAAGTAAVACAEAEATRQAAEVARLREALSDAEQQLAEIRDASAHESIEWRSQFDAMIKQLRAEQLDKEAAIALAAQRLTEQESRDLEQRCAEVYQSRPSPCSSTLSKLASLLTADHLYTTYLMFDYK